MQSTKQTIMTQKQKLYLEYLQFTKLVEQIGGKDIDIDKEMDNFYSNDWKVYELKEKVEFAKANYQRALKQNKIDKYYSTEEGKKIKEELEQKRDELVNLHESLFFTYEDKLKKLFDNILNGIDYKIKSFYHGGFSIGMVDENGDDIFGHGIDINSNYYDNAFTMNYGCMGSFNPLTNTKRVEFLKFMSIIAENFEIINETMMQFKHKAKEISKKISDVKENLNNPKI